MSKAFLTPQQTYEALIETGAKKGSLTLIRVIILGILAGVYIGFGAHLSTTVTTGTEAILGYGMSKFMGGAVFSVGLMLVMIAGAELFTGNTLITMSVLHKRVPVALLLRNWGIVFVANLIGSLFLVVLIFYAGINGAGDHLTAVGDNAVKIATAKASLPFVEVLLRGILANWLVCLAVVLAVSAQDVVGKIFACFFPVMAFVAMGFEHSIANMYFIPAGMLAAQGTVPALTMTHAINNVMAATIGNIIGGAFFVGVLYWVVYLKPEESTSPQTSRARLVLGKSVKTRQANHVSMR